MNRGKGAFPRFNAFPDTGFESPGVSNDRKYKGKETFPQYIAALGTSIVSLDTGKEAFPQSHEPLGVSILSLNVSILSLKRGKVTFPLSIVSLRRGKATFPVFNDTPGRANATLRLSWISLQKGKTAFPGSHGSSGGYDQRPTTTSKARSILFHAGGGQADTP